MKIQALKLAPNNFHMLKIAPGLTLTGDSKALFGTIKLSSVSNWLTFIHLDDIFFECQNLGLCKKDLGTPYIPWIQAEFFKGESTISKCKLY